MPFKLVEARLPDFKNVWPDPIDITASEFNRLKENQKFRLSPNTIRSYETAIRQWQTYAWEHDATWFPAENERVALWLSELTDKGMKIETLKQKVKALDFIHREKSQFQPGKSQVVMDALSACQNGRMPEKARGVGEDDFAKLLEVAGKRDRALLLCMRWLMLRPSEAAYLRWNDIDQERNTVTIRRSKTDQEGAGVVMHLPPNVRLALNEHKKANRTRTWVFRLTPNSVSRVIRRLATKAGLEGVSGHSLRRGMAGDLVRRGESVAEVMIAGRWETPAMVARYADEVAATGALVRYAEDENRKDVS